MYCVYYLFSYYLHLSDRNKIPKEHHKIRNCQLAVVLSSIAITMATSAMPNVDWAAHAGGAFQGALWGIILLSNELHSKYCQVNSAPVFEVLSTDHVIYLGGNEAHCFISFTRCVCTSYLLYGV
jgi:hypothetical protein